MFDFDENLILSLIFYFGACLTLYNMKLPVMFEDNGDFKSFGLDPDETIYPYWLVTSMIGLLSYYILVLRESQF